MEDMINDENVMTAILVIAFFTWLFIKDQEGAGK